VTKMKIMIEGGDEAVDSSHAEVVGYVLVRIRCEFSDLSLETG
jgi:hypothetical protein